MKPDERGVALLIAVAVLASVGALSLTALALAREERVAGLAALARVQARGAAESALAQALLGWPAAQTPSAVGSEYSVATTSVPGPATGSVRVRALGGPIYALEAEGIRRSVAGDLLGSVRLELLVTLSPPDSIGTTEPARYPRGWRVLP